MDDAGDDTRRVRKEDYRVVCSRCAGRTVVEYRYRHAMSKLVVDVFFSTANEPAGCWFNYEKATATRSGTVQ